ncbi:Legume lectin domain [Musa troglodytarum]|uniref:non-specific serine/threonine protein kinase n=1 Tax=Musa troglodytarum TaxID=320322 RepID=A0A9E7KV91_9LILI|nr:Legume lectin domain [Musa troglodytarum]
MSKRSILFSLLFSLSLSVAARQDEFTYIGFSGGANGDGSNISLNEVAEVDDSGILRLTNKTSRLIGHAFYPVALRFRNATSSAAFSFSTVFAFAIAPEYPKLGGHGLAFTIAPTKELPGALPSQYLGLVNASDVGNATNHVFAVEFDTVQDFEFGDINDNQVGVDIYGLVSNSNASAAYYGGDGAKKDLNLKDRFTIQAWIDYDGGEKVPNVTISPFSSKPSTPRLSFRVDLFPVLLDDMFVGFSASNGLLASSHNLLGWSFKMKCVSRFLDLSSLPSLPLPKKKNITLELKRATHGFRDRELLGLGRFGKVYRGTLPGSRAEVAVKRVSHESRQGIREFMAEIASIGRLRHRNLSPCGQPPPLLSWPQRFRILRGVASALLYLHEEWEQVVIHRDVKASNVLLDAEFNGRLGDFGMAKLHDHGANPSTTRVVGTLGYLAPRAHPYRQGLHQLRRVRLRRSGARGGVRAAAHRAQGVIGGAGAAGPVGALVLPPLGGGEAGHEGGGAVPRRRGRGGVAAVSQASGE